jgi:hypothetical protein
MQAFFRKEGEYWSIAYHDTTVRLRDAKGVRYVAHLLHNPGERFAARELMRVVDVDPSAASATTDLKPESDEQARLAVTKRIKGLVKRLEKQHPVLAYHLSAAVKTGAYCVYLPDPARPIDWRA